MNIKELLKHRAFNWVIDYKPFETNLDPSEYAQHGYEKGYEQAIKDVQEGLWDPKTNNLQNDPTPYNG